MTPVERRRLRRAYEHALKEAWDRWNDPVWRKGGPFFNLEDAPELDENPDYNHLVGWIQGVHDGTGWPLWPEGEYRRLIRSERWFVRTDFYEKLREVWAEYIDQNKGTGSPFHNLEDFPSLDESPNFNYDVGWLLGVSQAMSLPLDREVGPREWSPRW